MDDPTSHCLAGNSLLLTGLPGTGKTHLARTIAAARAGRGGAPGVQDALLHALSLLFVKSKTAHSASSEVVIQQMWILRKFGGFARRGHSPSACTSARVFSLLQYAGKTGPSRILCVSEV